MPKIASLSALSGANFRDGYACKFEWPEDCGCQGGTRGIVISKGRLEKALAAPATEGADVIVEALTSEPKSPGYITAFFEAFPTQPSCFLRGEGKSLEEAEAACWTKYQRILACPKHEFERRDRTDGYCFCRHCRLSGTYMEPLFFCTVCDEPAAHTHDRHGQIYCKRHTNRVPEFNKTDLHKMIDRMNRGEDE
jgi:hypothetical protein